MKNEKYLTMSNRDLARAQVVELGKILFNLQIIAAILFASPLPYAIYPMYYAVLIIICVLTGFAIFAVPGFIALWTPTKLYTVVTTITNSWMYTIPVVLSISLLSILFLCLDKNVKHLKRIIATIVIIVLVLLYFILRISIILSGGAN